MDNLLSHYELPGVEGARQGMARRISTTGVYHIALIRALSQEDGVTVRRAVSLGQRLLASNGEIDLELAPGLWLHFNREAFERHVDALLAEAVEFIAPARRGRPPRRPAPME